MKETDKNFKTYTILPLAALVNIRDTQVELIHNHVITGKIDSVKINRYGSIVYTVEYWHDSSVKVYSCFAHDLELADDTKCEKVVIRYSGL